MKVMVIDDEPIVRKGLQKLIAWEQYGFQWLGTAENGEEALELIEAKRPDLIIVDCKMPHMDGLQLLGAVNERGIALKSVILSGYDEFMYAQQALQLGASDYLLKPPDLERFLEVILRVKKEWEDENRLKQQLRDNYPVMVERFLLGLMAGGRQSPESFREKVEYLKLPIHSGPLRICRLEIEDETGQLDQYTIEDQQLIGFAVMNIIGETFEEWPAKVIFQEGSRRFIMLFNISGMEQVPQLRQLLLQLIDNLKATLKLGATIGVSRHFTSAINECKPAYEAAKIALQYKYYTGANKVIFLDDVEEEQGGVVAAPKEREPLHEEELFMSIRVCNENGLEAWLAAFALLLKEQGCSSHETKTLSLQQMIAVTHTMIEMHPQLQLDELLTAGDIEQIFTAGTLEELMQLLRGFLFKLLTLTQNLRKSGKNAVIERTKVFIQAQYAGNITLETIAAEVFLSPVYLSFLFKQVEAMNITDYIANIRIENAKRLLKTTSSKTYEIANLVGYQDDKYFSRIFKKKVGMTPSEYRNQI
ncbi:response regulator [Paenibacillus oenotherae]|uniref:Response regulator n=1 Tax=Paenibacillus oenotherae TaxID=1435645 RepID=A0ABS7D659_9BACL|nr:response regulator [Paenibacillus oenotherae]MBW7475429.1 response regulator [Paenibacillus oenotherae]